MLQSPTPTGRKAAIFAPKERTARVVIALGETARTGTTAYAFREQGWDVHVTNSPGEARRLVRKLRPMAVVLDAAPAKGESGWLVCKKLLLEHPTLKVVLLRDRATERDHRLAQFVGAVACVSNAVPSAAVRAATGFELPSLN
jgi:DNA-binding response OmpR family regulator